VHFVDINNIFIDAQQQFSQYCAEIYEFQYQNNPVYQHWVDLIRPNASYRKIPGSIPLLPIQCFKDYEVITGSFDPEKVFESSGTTGMITSKHFVKSLHIYEQSFLQTFQLFYGDIRDWCILALLPSYLERDTSSLVYMADHLIQKSGHSKSGFYLYNHSALNDTIQELEQVGQKTILLGVTFALLDFSMAFKQQLKHTIVMETGGMKGRGKELTKMELHHLLCKNFGVETIHAEYGMTELLSQAYSTGNGRYVCPPWMKVMVQSEDDPLLIETVGIGLLVIIDLANIYSCCFIATEDIAKVYEDGSFEVLGRMDYSDLRGCSLMVI
jgi:hypothetical protein